MEAVARVGGGCQIIGNRGKLPVCLAPYDRDGKRAADENEFWRTHQECLVCTFARIGGSVPIFKLYRQNLVTAAGGNRKQFSVLRQSIGWCKRVRQIRVSQNVHPSFRGAGFKIEQ